MKKILVLCGVVALLALSVAAGDGKAMGCCARQSAVTRSVATIDNGVKVTMTSTDATMVAMMHDKAPTCTKGACDDCPMHAEGVTRSVENTADGIVVTATAADPTLVAKLQAHAAKDAASCAKSEAKASCCAKGKTEAAGCAHGAEKSKTDAAGCAHGAEAAPKTT
jgi:hypothetical protein